MRKILFLFLFSLCSLAQADNISLGYSNGEIASSSPYTLKEGSTKVPGEQSAAVYIEPSLFEQHAGAYLSAIRVGLVSVKFCEAVTVWVRESLTGDDLYSGTIKRGGTPSPVQGWNEVVLDTPMKLTAGKGFYIGFTYSQRYKDATISVVGAPRPNTSYIKLGASAEWQDVSDSGVISLEMLVSSDELPQCDMKVVSASGVEVAPGTYNLSIDVTNNGQMDVSEFDITFAAEEYEYVHRVMSPVASGTKSTLSVELHDMPLDVGFSKPLTATITRIAGGEDAFPDDNALKVSMNVLRNVVVEEFTGTGCGWCPRGLVGMDKLHDKYGLRFVGIAMHGFNASDPMYFTYPGLTFEGAPQCFIDRAINADPYYGIETDICEDFEEEMKASTMLGVFVHAAYNADMTAVDVTASISPLVSMTGSSLGVVLTADSLTGTGAVWKQANSYVSYQSSSLPDDLAMFGNGGELGQSSFAWSFNDVAIASYNSGGSYEIAVGGLTKFERKTITTTIPMPTKKVLQDAINPRLVAANVFLIGSDKKIINGAKAYVVDMTDDVKELHAASHAHAGEVARYALDGRMLASPQKGINIIRLSDGTTRKLVVK